MKQLLLPIFDFLKRPQEFPDQKYSIKKKISCFGFLLLLEIPLMFLLKFFQDIPDNFGFIDSSQHRIIKMVENGDLLYLILTIVLIAPVLEELVIRLPLRLKRNNFIPLLFLGILLNGTMLVYKTQHGASWLLLIPVLVSGIFAFIIFTPFLFEKAAQFLKSKYTWYFYFITLVFALLHLGNYRFSWYLILFAPLLVLPQFTAGLLLGFVRNNFGFGWGVLFHIAHNALFLLPIYLLLHPTKTEILVDLEKEGYKIEITEIASNYISTDFKITPNEIYLKAPFEQIISRLTNTDVRNVEFKKALLAEKHLQVHFTNDSAYQSENTDTAVQLVLQNVLNEFELELVKENRWVSERQLSICNADLFQKQLCESDSIQTKFRSFYGSKDTIELPQTNSKMLAKLLERNLKINVDNQMDSDGVFAIKIPNSSPQKLDKYFSENYGIAFKNRRAKRNLWVVK